MHSFLYQDTVFLALIGALEDKMHVCEEGFLEKSGGLSVNGNSLRELSVLRIELDLAFNNVKPKDRYFVLD